MAARIAILALTVWLVTACSGAFTGSDAPSAEVPSVQSSEPVPDASASPPPSARPTTSPEPSATDEPTPTIEPTAEPTATPNPAFAGCPTEQARIVATVQALDLRLIVEGRELAYNGTISLRARDGSYDGSDQIPSYAFLDLGMDPIVVEAGSRIHLRERGARLVAVTGASRARFDRFSFDGLPQYDGPEPLALASGARDGGGWIQAPRREGTWVIELFPTWQTRCFEGSGINWFVLRTR